MDECGIFYWAAIDKQWQKLREDIKKENKFIGETHYSTEKFNIKVGISGARGYVTCVKLIFKSTLESQSHQITFLSDEWEQLINILKLARFNVTVPDQIIPLAEGNLRITADDENCVCIAYEYDDSESGIFIPIILNSEDVHEMISIIDTLISYKLKILNNLNFKDYIDIIAKISKDKIRQLCLQNICELNYYVMEYLERK